jgi:HAD superfamily hydrolase (TIGR01509 family)
VKLKLQNYKLIIFDWDGTLVDSLAAYAEWDRLYVKRFYGVDLPIEYYEELALRLKSVVTKGEESKYFRHLDEQHGSGDKSMDQIWEDIYSLAPEIQRNVVYKENAVKVLKFFRSTTDAHVALATNAERRDIQFYSSEHSQTAQALSPLTFFNMIVTSDDVQYPKPHPQTFQKVIDAYGVAPREVLIFEDSHKGVQAALMAGADVIAISGDKTVADMAHGSIEHWADLPSVLEGDMA